MPVPILLRLTPEDHGGWRVLVTTPHGRPGEGVVSTSVVTQIRAAVAAVEAIEPRAVLVPGQDGAWRRAEQDVSRALVDVLGASQEVTKCFARQEGQAVAQHTVLLVAIDAADPEIRRLPWELLASDRDALDYESARVGVIVRLVGGRDVPLALPQPSGLDVVVWSPTPRDPLCAEVVAGLETQLSRLDLGPARLIDPLVDGPPTNSGSATVLHVVCHGRRGVDELELLLDGRPADGGGAARSLGGWLDVADLVVLDVCEAGSHTADVLDHLPARLLAAGARACVAPTRRVSARAVQAFAGGFYATYSRGRSLAESVAGGRFAVARLGVGHPHSRWHNHLLYVGDLRVASQSGPSPSEWRPTGWPTPSRAVAELLNGAREVALRDGVGFIGLEHLGHALVASQGGGSFVGLVRSAIAARLHHLAAFKKGCVHPAGRTVDEEGTPRLRSWGRHLAPGFSLEDLWRVIAADSDHVLQEFSRPALRALIRRGGPISVVPPDGRTIEPDTVSGDWSVGGPTPETPSFSSIPDDLPRLPATALQVVGGPEDGRVLRPRPGDQIGRYAELPDVAIGLYEATWLVDRALHRRHAVWLGPGRLRVEERSRRLRAGTSEPVDAGEVDLLTGDLLCLTPATWLRALAG